MIGAALGSVVGGLASASAAKKGAQAQADAAAESNETQRYIFDRSVELSEPYRETGNNALAALAFETGIGPRPSIGATPSGLTIEEIAANPGNAGGRQVMGYDERTGDPIYGEVMPGNEATSAGFRVGGRTFGDRGAAQTYLDSLATPGTPYAGIQESPGYRFTLDQGMQGIERMAAARGNRLSGATLKEAGRYNSGLASQDYGNGYNRLAGLAGVGQAAVSQQIGAGQAYAGAVGQNNAMAGQARASGYMGVPNAFNGTINSLGNLYGAVKGGAFGENPGFGIKPSPAGLSAWGWTQ